MTKNKPWKSFLIFGIRHQEEFKVVKIILEKYGYKFDENRPHDYKECVFFFPGRDGKLEGFSVVSKKQQKDDYYIKSCLSFIGFEFIGDIKEFLKWHRSQQLN